MWEHHVRYKAAQITKKPHKEVILMSSRFQTTHSWYLEQEVQYSSVNLQCAMCGIVSTAEVRTIDTPYTPELHVYYSGAHTTRYTSPEVRQYIPRLSL